MTEKFKASLFWFGLVASSDSKEIHRTICYQPADKKLCQVFSGRSWPNTKQGQIEACKNIVRLNCN